MKRCEFCGKEITFLKECDCEAAQEHNKEQNTNPKNKLYKIMAAVGAIVATLVILVIALANSKIDAFEYLTVSFEGVNTQGAVKTVFDKKTLISSIIGEEPSEINLKQNIAWQEDYDRYKNDIKISYDESRKLSNGDSITITIDVTGNAASKIAGGQKEYIVSNLPEAQLIDVFEYVEVKTTGINGKGSLEITVNKENDFIKICSFTTDKNLGLSNGDEVTITVEYDSAEAVRLGFAPKETTKKVSISGLVNYATSVSQFSIDQISSFANQFLEEEKDKEVDIFSYSDFKHHNTWFCVQKEGVSYNNTYNMLRICVSYKEYLRGEYRRTVYTFLDFKNVLVDSNGKVSLKYDDGNNSTFTTNIEKSLLELKEDYMVSEVK